MLATPTEHNLVRPQADFVEILRHDGNGGNSGGGGGSGSGGSIGGPKQ
jgi:hypothetical protein